MSLRRDKGIALVRVDQASQGSSFHKKLYGSDNALGRVKGSVAFVLVAAILLAGCTASTRLESLTPQGPFLPARPHVVVGIVDTGVNPYHEAFQEVGARLPPDLIDARNGKPPIVLRLWQAGTWEERMAHDRDIWAGLQPGVLYWFEGTRILAISFEHGEEGDLLRDHANHGTGVVDGLHRIAPEAWMVMVQSSGNPIASGPAAFQEANESLRWLITQPWVDLVTTEYVATANPPGLWETMGFTDASRTIALSGRPFVNAAGNDPQPTVIGGTSGPPWVIAAGGVEPLTRGDVPEQSRLVDVVADSVGLLADYHSTTNYTYHAGTSFASPRVAATLAQALLKLREDANDTAGLRDGVLCACRGRDVTARDLREALNLSAVYWNTTDWDPTKVPTNDPLGPLAYSSVPELPAPWLQMGWGYVGNMTWQSVVAHIAGAAQPDRPSLAVQYMAAQQALREAYWQAHP